MQKLLFQSGVLIISFLIVYFWQMTSLSLYTVPLLGFLVALFLITSAKNKGRGFLTLGQGSLGVFILTTLILLLIFSTESINSPLFFLLYFLGFGIAFVFEPITVFVFVIGAVLIFFPDAVKTDLTTNLIKLGSLALISPLAYFFGKEYQKDDLQNDEIQRLKERSQDSADTIAKDIKEVIEDEKESLKDKDMDKLNEILEESEDLRQEIKE